ncbi:Tetratricopeptide repeat [seawater metagenome]|uniref:Tetratricopeptide repeat n=1 Tax=seawater metagenome TaxID=1561972 RepID=A0A5E8CJ63_9ZZZZ
MNCEQLKNLGNEQFKEGNFKNAIEFFEQAIVSDPDNHILYSNRSAAYLSLGNGDLALQDAEKCIELNEDWIKGWGRKGAALHMLGKYEESIKSFNHGLEIEEGNIYLKSGLELVLKDKEKKDSLKGGPMGDMMEKLMQNKEINNKMNDPEFIKKIYEYQKNPFSMMQDPEMMQIFGKIMSEMSPPENTETLNGTINSDSDTDTDSESDES